MKDRIAELISPRPMVVLTLIFTIGIILEDLIQLGFVVQMILFAIFFLSFFILDASKRQPSLIFLLLISGGLRTAVHDSHSVNSLISYEVKADSVYWVAGMVEAIGETRKGTPKFTISPLAIDNSAFSDGMLILYAKDLEIIPVIGDTLIAPMNLIKPRPKRNPNDFDYQKYLFGKEIYLEAFIADINQVTIGSKTGSHIYGELSKLRNAIKQYFLKSLYPRSAGVMSALILGERSDVDEETKTNFANTGVIHVLAVSGLHVGYVSLILITIIGMFRLPYNYQTILVILGLGFYVILTGGAASVMRASIMASLMLLSTIIERKTDIYNTLATAAFIILMLDPSQLEGIGFQLSFSAVLSIVSLYPIFREWIPQASAVSNSWFTGAIDRVVDLFLVSLAAQLGTLGLTMFYFNKIPIISLFANLLVVPIIGLIVSTGMTSLLIGSCIPVVANLWGALIDTLVDFMLWFVAFCARFDWAYVTTRNLHLIELVLIIIAVFGVTAIAIKKIPKLWFILILLWGQYIVWSDLFTPRDLEVIMLDVGQGDAVVVHTPDDKTIVIDAGLRFGGKDMGEKVISPYLRDRNWNTIELLVLTHPHNDHIGGAHYLLENHVVKRVMMQNVEYDSYSYRKLQRTLDSLQIPIQSVYTGIVDSTFNPVYLRVTGPKKFDFKDRPSNVNNISIVFQLLYGETSILFTGDAEHEIEKDQLPLGSLLQSDLIKAPHHGSKTSSSERYINLVDPQVCLISLGTRNKYKHPAPVTMNRYENREVKIHRTDLEGAIIYTSNGKEWTHDDWRTSGN